MANQLDRTMARLKIVEADWPKGYLLFADGNALRLCKRHPQDGGKVIESYSIPNDGGGDPEIGTRNEER